MFPFLFLLLIRCAGAPAQQKRRKKYHTCHASSSYGETESCFSDSLRCRLILHELAMMTLCVCTLVRQQIRKAESRSKVSCSNYDGKAPSWSKTSGGGLVPFASVKTLFFTFAHIFDGEIWIFLNSPGSKKKSRKITLSSYDPEPSFRASVLLRKFP